MTKLDKTSAINTLKTDRVVNMSVCNSCASCGCGGSRCVSTCKGCHDKDVDLKSVSDIYSDNDR